ncbi:MAG TPA: universal stress protein [Steroidobacteraceae bacterium]|nr:universal stress protein [Steroidobacteraceae bacterium]
MYQRILLAYDGSIEGRTALREGALLARRYGAQVFVLSVIREAAGTKLGEGVGGGGVAQQRIEYERVLQEGMARLAALGFQASGKLVIGEPAREIAVYAEQVKADLVVVGHRRQSAVGRWWSGPSGAYLSDHIPCSLLVCRNVIDDEHFASLLAQSTAAASVAPGAGHAAAMRGAPAAGIEADTATAPRPAPVMHAPSPTPGPAHPAPSAARRRLRVVLFVLLPLILIAGFIVYALGGGTISTDDAYVEANTVGVSTDVSGVVAQVYVKENQRVTQGQILYTLRDKQYRYALDRANAQLDSVRDNLLSLQASYRDMQARIAQARYDLGYNQVQFNRARNLARVQIESKTGFDTAHRNLSSAQEALASLNEQLAGIAANLNGHPTGPVEAYPQYLSALAARNEAARQLAHTVVRAPFDGIVTSVPSIQPGRYLAASITAFYLVDTGHAWVHADPKETELTYVRPGQAVTVRVDTYPGETWHGTVESISPAAAQQFSLLPAENTSGNWVKVVQRIPLRIAVDTSDRNMPPLRAGMSVEISIHTGHSRGWSIL